MWPVVIILQVSLSFDICCTFYKRGKKWHLGSLHRQVWMAHFKTPFERLTKWKQIDQTTKAHSLELKSLAAFWGDLSKMSQLKWTSTSLTEAAKNKFGKELLLKLSGSSCTKDKD